LIVTGIEASNQLYYSNRSEVLKIGGNSLCESFDDFPSPLDGGFTLKDQDGASIICGGYR